MLSPVGECLPYAYVLYILVARLNAFSFLLLETFYEVSLAEGNRRYSVSA